MIGVTEKLAEIQGLIHLHATNAGRDPAGITLVAVGKRQPLEKLEALAAGGHSDFGENFLGEALEKQASLARFALNWHFIGTVQSNKTRAIAESFDWVHTIDRSRIARRLSDQRSLHAPPLNVCIQVNIDAESSKTGVSPDEAYDLASAIVDLPRLRLRGLMCIPRPTDDHDQQRRPYRRLRELKEELISRGIALDSLSMGMSNDLAAAIGEGATHVRIGTALFGARPAAEDAR